MNTKRTAISTFARINLREIGGFRKLSLSRIKLAEPLFKIIHHLNFFFLGELTVPPVRTI
jgi:hypothetical protein